MFKFEGNDEVGLGVEDILFSPHTELREREGGGVSRVGEARSIPLVRRSKIEARIFPECICDGCEKEDEKASPTRSDDPLDYEFRGDSTLLIAQIETSFDGLL
jgi:hypothetical protein